MHASCSYETDVSDFATLRSARTRATDRTRAPAGLLAFFGPDVDRPFFTPIDDGMSVIGREAAADVSIEDPSISRRHAAIDRTRAVTTLGDLGSANGVFVNGERIRTRALADGDLVRVGDTLLRFFAAWPHAQRTIDPKQGEMVGGVALEPARRLLRRAAQTTSTVLVVGETGTGKELAARALCRDGPRRDGPFVAVNCAALPSELMEAELFGATRGAYTGADAARTGLVRAADGGTLFLDEIGDLPLVAQAKLLRVLELHRVRPIGTTEEIEVDVRVVAATNADLVARVRDGAFRLDLYGRIARIVIELVPLRAHFEDIPALVEHFLGDDANRVHVDAMERLCLRRWPANVRGLNAALERATFQAEGARVLGVEHFQDPAEPEEAEEAAPPANDADDAELAALVDALRGAEGQVEVAAAKLGIGRSQLYRRAQRHGLTIASFRPE